MVLREKRASQAISRTFLERIGFAVPSPRKAVMLLVIALDQSMLQNLFWWRAKVKFIAPCGTLALLMPYFCPPLPPLSRRRRRVSLSLAMDS